MTVLAHADDGPADARVLVLVGSIGSTSEMWTPMLAPLREQFRVIRIDHRGHGSSHPVERGTGATTIDDLGADLLATMDDLGLERVDFAGLSLGGMLGMWLAVHHPHRVARLALICTSAHPGAAASWQERAATVRADGMRAISSAVVARWVTPQLAARDARLVGDLRAMVDGIDAESYAQCCEAIAELDLRADLARIAAPTLVVAGAQDPAFDVAHARTLHESISLSHMQILDPAAHVPTFERPGRLAGALLAHFRGGGTVEQGFATRRAVLGDEHVDRAVAATTSLTAPFQEFLTRYAWGDVWSREELSRGERSLVTIAALVALGAEHELAMHVRAARRNGLTDEQIIETMLHTALYAGLPRANRAIAIARDVLTEDG